MSERDPRPEPPDYDAVRFTGNYSDLGEQEELRRDYERELAEWETRQVLPESNPSFMTREEALSVLAVVLSGGWEPGGDGAQDAFDLEYKEALDVLYPDTPEEGGGAA